MSSGTPLRDYTAEGGRRAGCCHFSVKITKKEGEGNRSEEEKGLRLFPH